MSRVQKKIAVIIRERQSEALRMALGLTILNDIDIYILDRKIELTDNILLNLDMIRELGLRLYTNTHFNDKISGIEFMTTEDIAKNLLKYDNVLPY